MPSCPSPLRLYPGYRFGVRHKIPPYHLYQHDSDPESYHHNSLLSSWVPSALPTPALRIQDPRLRCDKNLGWNIDWAVAFLVDFLDQKNSPDAATALKNIRVRASALEKQGNALEIPYRIFNKLDETLFAGHLENAVYLDIRKMNPNVSGATHTHGWGLDPKVKRVSIYLNKDILQLSRSRDLVGILIHHMIHAYFLIACGPQVEKEIEYGRLSHGLHFGKIMVTIKNLSGLNGLPLASLDFGHTLGQSRLFYDEYHYPQRKPCHRRCGKEKWYCSHCTADVPALSESELEEWYTGICKPLLDLPSTLRSSTVHIYNPLRHLLEEVPRAETTPSTKSSEFLFDDKSVLVPSAQIDTLFSLRRAFENSGSRYMQIHEDVSPDTSTRFLELLHTGSYGPAPKHILALGRRGPPVIKSPTASDPYLLTDVRIYKMGALMGFAELKGVALDRMYRYGVTHEDPVDLLAELYAGGEPDADCKAWTRKFLSRVPSTTAAGDAEWLGVGAAMTTAEPSNLAKLECEMLGFYTRFDDLLQRSSALNYEVAQARKELVGMGMYAANASAVGASLALQRSLGPGAVPMPIPMPMPVGSVRHLQWVAAAQQEEMERRAAAASAMADPYPFYGRGLGYAESFYDDVHGHYYQ